MGYDAAYGTAAGYSRGKTGDAGIVGCRTLTCRWPTVSDQDALRGATSGAWRSGPVGHSAAHQQRAVAAATTDMVIAVRHNAVTPPVLN